MLIDSTKSNNFPKIGDDWDMLLQHVDAASRPSYDLAGKALVMESIGRYTNADGLYKQAIKECDDRNLGSDHPIRLCCMSKRAITLMNRCRYFQAQQLSEDTLHRLKRRFDPANEMIQSCSNNLARILRYRGNSKAAYDLLVETLESSSSYPLDSLLGITLVSNLAKALKDLRLYEECELKSRMVVKACHHLLGPDHPFTWNRESDLSAVLSKMGHYTVAKKIARRTLHKLNKLLGSGHPDALRASKRVANCTRFQNRPEDAAPLLQRTFDYQKKLFTLEHPDTLSTSSSLAAVYAMQGHTMKAATMLDNALELRRKLLAPAGDQHPDISWTLHALSKIDTALDKENRGIQLGPGDLSLGDRSVNPTEVELCQGTTVRKALICRQYDSLSVHEDARTLLPTSSDANQSVIEKTLRAAAAACRTSDVEDLVQKGANINAEGAYRGTALEAASFNNNRQTVKFLLTQSGVDVDARRGGALRAACYRGHKNIVQDLLESNASVNLEDPVLGTPLQAALAGGHANIVEYLFGGYHADLAIAAAQDALFGTPLQSAVVNGHKHSVGLLLKNGADPNSSEKGYFGNAFELAALTNRKDILGMLLNFGGDIDPVAFQHAFLEAVAVGSTNTLSSLLSPGSLEISRVRHEELLSQALFFIDSKG